MPEVPVPLSAVGLRLVGEVGQAALDELAVADAGEVAEFDQHVAAVRADLADCQGPRTTTAQRAGVAAWRSAPRPGSDSSGSFGASRVGAGGQQADCGQVTGPASPELSGDGLACPDVPFAASAFSPEPVPPLRLLLHYACGLIEAAVSDDWWPGETSSADLMPTDLMPGELDSNGIDWPSMRMAAICHLVTAAEAAAQLPPDLQTLAEGHTA